LAKEAIKHFRSTHGYTKLKDKEWLHAQLEEMGIRDFSPTTKNTIKDIVIPRTNNSKEKTIDLHAPDTNDTSKPIDRSDEIQPSFPNEELHDPEDGECSDVHSENTEVENIPSYEGETKVTKIVFYVSFI
jgi:hypothetical protein